MNPNREKVIKGIQECDLNGGLIGNCPYKDILALLKEQDTLLEKAYELLADMGLDFFCDDLMCDDGWCDEHCGKSGKIGPTPKCAERWLRKKIEEGRWNLND